MSMKAARGAKRVCQSCGSKFYDLNRDPITCPICNAVFMDHDAKPKAVLAGNAEDDDDDEVLTPAKGVEVVSLEEVAADETDDIPDLEDSDLAVDDEEEDLGGDDEDFIAVEDDDEDDDVTAIVSGPREDDEEV